jgi:hypothetical protein
MRVSSSHNEVSPVGPTADPAALASNRPNIAVNMRVAIDRVVAANFLHDLGPPVLERPAQATATVPKDAFEKVGTSAAPKSSASCSQQWAAAFQIDRPALCLDGVDSESDLL